MEWLTGIIGGAVGGAGGSAIIQGVLGGGGLDLGAVAGNLTADPAPGCQATRSPST